MSAARVAPTLPGIFDAVVATDDNARITFLNPPAETLTGWSYTEAIGSPASSFRVAS